MTTRTSVEQSLAALVACDQSYFQPGQVNVGKPLGVLPDGPQDNSNVSANLYTDTPAFKIPDGYTIAAIIERPEIGAKALILQNAATKDTIVAFGGTDGVNAQDYVANTQSFGWSQWRALSESRIGEQLKGSASHSFWSSHATSPTH